MLVVMGLFFDSGDEYMNIYVMKLENYVHRYAQLVDENLGKFEKEMDYVNAGIPGCDTDCTIVLQNANIWCN